MFRCSHTIIRERIIRASLTKGKVTPLRARFLPKGG